MTSCSADTGWHNPGQKHPKGINFSTQRSSRDYKTDEMGSIQVLTNHHQDQVVKPDLGNCFLHIRAKTVRSPVYVATPSSTWPVSLHRSGARRAQVDSQIKLQMYRR